MSWPSADIKCQKDARVEMPSLNDEIYHVCLVSAQCFETFSTVIFLAISRLKSSASHGLSRSWRQKGRTVYLILTITPHVWWLVPGGPGGEVRPLIRNHGQPSIPSCYCPYMPQCPFPGKLYFLCAFGIWNVIDWRLGSQLLVFHFIQCFQYFLIDLIRK